MKRNRILVALAILTCACSAPRQAAETAPVINEIAIVAPYSRVDVLGKDGYFHYSDSLSAVSELLALPWVLALLLLLLTAEWFLRKYNGTI